MNTGYVKIPVAAAKAIHAHAKNVGAEEALTELMGYLKFCWHEYPGPRELRDPGRKGGFSAVGAHAIKKVVTPSDAHARSVLQTLRSPPPALSKQPFVEATGMKQGLSPVYRLVPWEGPIAYLPAIIWDKDGMGALKKIQDAPVRAQRRLDALYLLIELYARVDYDWLAAPPDRFVYQDVDLDGECYIGDDIYALGARGDLNEYGLWLAQPDGTWRVDAEVGEELFGDAWEDRCFAAVELLLEAGLVCKVLVAETDESQYPMYVHNNGVAKNLNEFGIVTDLARRCQRAAEAASDDAARALAAAAAIQPGTGLYYIASYAPPTAYVLLMPCLQAPTPENLSGMAEMGIRTSKMRDVLKQAAGATASVMLNVDEDFPF